MWSRTFIAALALFVLTARAPGGDVAFYRDVQPILKKHCTICHSDENIDEIDASGGVSLDHPDAILSGKIKIVTAKQPDSSPLYLRLVAADVHKRMPKDDEPLAADKIATIRSWIEGGMPLGEPLPSPKRERKRSLTFFDLTIPTPATPPNGLFKDVPPGKISLVAQMAPLAPVTAVAFNPVGDMLAAGSYRRIVLWDLKRGTAATVLSDPAGMVHDLEFSPDGKTLWMGGGEAGVSGEIRSYASPFDKPAVVIDDPRGVVYRMAISPDGATLAAVGFDNCLRTFEIPSGKRKFVVKAHSDFVYGLSFSKDGSQLATCGKDKTIKLWDPCAGKSTRSLTGHDQEVFAVLFSPDAQMVYSAGMEPQLRKWDLKKADRPQRQNGHGGTVYEMAWDRNWSRFVSCGSDRTVRTWKPNATPDKTLQGATDVVYSAALSPDGKLAAAGSWDGYLRIWDVESGKLQATLLSAERADGQTADWLAFTPSGYFSGSKSLSTRATWTMSNKPLPYSEVTSAMEKPDEIANAFAGKATDKVSFPAPPQPAKPQVKAEAKK